METNKIEGNKLIINFMGLKPVSCYGRFSLAKDHCTCTEDTPGAAISGFASIAKYPTSWDWLMPVLLNIGERTGWTLVMEESTSYWCNEGQHDELEERGGYSNIQNIWENVVAFLNWNKNNLN